MGAPYETIRLLLGSCASVNRKFVFIQKHLIDFDLQYGSVRSHRTKAKFKFFFTFLFMNIFHVEHRGQNKEIT